MNTFFIKIIFMIFTFFIFIYNCSYAGFEIIKKSNISGGIMFFIFSLISIVFSNIMFFIS